MVCTIPLPDSIFLHWLYPTIYFYYNYHLYYNYIYFYYNYQVTQELSRVGYIAPNLLNRLVKRLGLTAKKESRDQNPSTIISFIINAIFMLENLNLWNIIELNIANIAVTTEINILHMIWVRERERELKIRFERAGVLFKEHIKVFLYSWTCIIGISEPGRFWCFYEAFFHTLPRNT